MSNAVFKVHGSQAELPTVLGQGPARIPTGGKIRAGIKVLTAKAAAHPDARAIYERGLAAGESFVQIEQALAAALPQLKTPLTPKNVSWFTVRGQDFANPEIARQILAAHSEDRGDGFKRLYRFPVVFPSDYWQVVMPHELAAWGAAEKHYWSEYSPDGRVRYCKQHASVPFDDTGKRVIRLFGGRKTMLREQNEGLCDPESCREYQLRQCNLTGRFLFFIPGIRSISAFELHTNSFYAMNMAIQKFETISFLRGGRISGFLDSQRTPFYLTKKLMEVARIDEQGRAVRVPQWIIDLEAPVDVTALIRQNEDEGAVIVQARQAAQVLEGAKGLEEGNAAANQMSPAIEPADSPPDDKVAWKDIAVKGPTFEQVSDRAKSYGIDRIQYEAYADQRWGRGWRLNAFGRQHAYDELERYRNDPKGYLDKIDCAMQGRA
ncbi:hypothetical protein [Rhodoferax ferrireducens]|uniref:recombination directionality factor n=1 Tax=Rhodoferax ferrireducens TaxID=192843 RepID=UPI000E0CCBD3|nr:hypothetical protein [Rhodoferax ferrireducens]